MEKSSHIFCCFSLSQHFSSFTCSYKPSSCWWTYYKWGCHK